PRRPPSASRWTTTTTPRCCPPTTTAPSATVTPPTPPSPPTTTRPSARICPSSDQASSAASCGRGRGVKEPVPVRFPIAPAVVFVIRRYRETHARYRPGRLAEPLPPANIHARSRSRPALGDPAT